MNGAKFDIILIVVNNLDKSKIERQGKTIIKKEEKKTQLLHIYVESSFQKQNQVEIRAKSS
jgi:hypothetical protein